MSLFTVFRLLAGFLTGGNAARTVVVAGVAAGMAAVGTWKLQEWRHAALERDRITRAARDLAHNVERRDRSLGTYIEESRNAQTVYRTIEKEVERIVERPVYRDQCFDADGLRHLGDAIDGRLTEPGAGQAVPAAGQAR